MRKPHNCLYNSQTREFPSKFDSTSRAPPNTLGGVPRSGRFYFIVCVCVWPCVCLGSRMDVCYVLPMGVRGSRLVGQTLQLCVDGDRNLSSSAAQVFPAYCKFSGTISWPPFLGSVARARFQRAPLPIASVASRPMYVWWCFSRATLTTPLPKLGPQHFQQLLE